MGLLGDLGMGQDACQVEADGQALSNSLLKSAVTPGECQLLSASERPGKAGPGQMLLRCKGAIPRREANLMKCLDDWANILFTGAREGFPGQ